MNGLHLPERVRARAAERPTAPAITSGDRTLTNAEFDASTSRVASALAAVVAPGGRVGALLRMGLEGAEAFVACTKAGVVFVPLNWRLPPDEIAAIAVDAELEVLITDAEFAAAAAATRSALPALTVVLVGDGAAGLPDTRPWAEFAASGDGVDPGFGDDPDAEALQLYTSGTTGRPKGVVARHRNLHNDPEGLTIYRFRTDSVALNTLPLFHIAGAGFLSTCLSAGAHSVLRGEFSPSAVADLIERHRISHAFLVPTTIAALLDLPGLAGRDLSSLEVVAYGSSPITPALLRRAMDALGCGFVQRYGMTETTGSVTALSVDDHDPIGDRAALLRSAGTPMPGAEVQIRDLVTGEILPAGETGEIVCRSRSNVAGYWRRDDPDLFTRDGFLRTGDAGHLDENGYLFVTDRVKDMIITGGENVYPVEVEAVLAEHPAVAEVAVVGVPDARWGESVTAVVRIADGERPPTETELVAFSADRLASYKKPRRIHFVTQMPRNASGKVLKRSLRESLSVGDAS